MPELILDYWPILVAAGIIALCACAWLALDERDRRHRRHRELVKAAQRVQPRRQPMARVTTTEPAPTTALQRDIRRDHRRTIGSDDAAHLVRSVQRAVGPTDAPSAIYRDDDPTEGEFAARTQSLLDVRTETHEEFTDRLVAGLEPGPVRDVVARRLYGAR